MKKSRIVLVLCMMVVIAVASVAGTIAWLTDTTDPVTNTFTTAGIDIDLTETPNQANGKWSAQLIPGKEYAKNPVVSVVRVDDPATEKVEGPTDVDIYLFVKVTETNSPKNYLSYQYAWEAADSGWTPLDGVAGVYYRTVGANDTEISWDLIVGNKVTVLSTLKKDGMPAAEPTITFTAYAIQQAGFATAELAWDEIGN